MKTRETGTEGHNITKDIDKKVIGTTGHSNPKKRKTQIANNHKGKMVYYYTPTHTATK